MRLHIVTGANQAYFPTLLVLLQSFAEQVGGTLPFVCDYGLATGQREFLRRRGLLLDRPSALGPPMAVLREKAMLRQYFRHSGVDADAADAIVWVDGDLTLVDCSRADFEHVAAEMIRRKIKIAASPQGPIGWVLDTLRRQGLGPQSFEQLLGAGPIDSERNYYSTGIFLCGSPDFLDRWAELSRGAAEQPVLDQNVFNAVVCREQIPVMPLDIDVWQAQGDTIDRLQTAPEPLRGHNSVLLDGRPVKILHATSTSIRHLLIGRASFTSGDLVLEGAFKLLRPDALLDLQLGLLSRFLAEHRTELLEIGLCRLAPTAIAGYEFRVAGRGDDYSSGSGPR